MERTKAETLAGSLNYLVRAGLVPGLLPKDVTEAATLLVEQERELASLSAALAAKDHIVTAEVTERGYRKEIRGEFVIADPRRYYSEITIDAFMVEQRNPDWVQHVARNLVSAATQDWQRDLAEKAFVAVRNALAQVDTHAKRGDVEQAPSLMGSPVPATSGDAS